jgi:signal transduction histidine kinase
MERLVQDLLDLSTIEAGHVLPIAPRPIQPSKIISEVCESMETQMEEKLVELDWPVSSMVPEVMADSDQIARVLLNLLGNALKFTPSGGRITVDAKQIQKEVRFQVSDTGQGISEADLVRVFEPFWQARRKPQSGVGLGLPIAKGIIEGHKGKIWVESKVGEGSTFYFTLPIAGNSGSNGI